MKRDRGLTVVELLIALVIITAIVIASLYILRQRRAEQHRQLQINADKAPLTVFEIAFRTDPDPIVAGEDFVIFLEVRNPTPYPLEFNWYDFEYRLGPSQQGPPIIGNALTAHRHDAGKEWRFTSGLDEPPIQGGRTRTYRLDIDESKDIQRDALTASITLIVHPKNEELPATPPSRAFLDEDRHLLRNVAVVAPESETK